MGTRAQTPKEPNDAQRIAAYRKTKAAPTAQPEAAPTPTLEVTLHATEKKKIAIVGYAPSSKDLAPYKDESWEIWGVNELYRLVPRVDVLFEIHDYASLRTKIRNPKHMEWLQTAKIPIYMQERHKDIPTSLQYPREAILQKFGSYFTNSISWMIALAFLFEPEELGLWGVDMATAEEYQSQRPSIEYFIGIAQGMYLLTGKPKIYIPPQCDLLKTFWLYGYENEQQAQMLEKMKARLKELDGRIRQYQGQAEEAFNAMNQMVGAKDDLQYMMRAYSNMRQEWAGEKARKK